MGEMLRSAWIGMQLKCPACKTGRIYCGLTRMNEACPSCGVVFEREEGDFLGAVVVAYSITAVLVAGGVYAVEVLTDLDATAHVLLWSLVGAGFLITTYRNMKGIWLGILHAMTGLQTR
ncbi:MAG TPA: DUF983 domain-containing protein [Symbiobacteriaceae bacterium]|nr:DUF983 domain-containing protein [Symbiobacteriaceae bacterium]